MRTVRIWEGGQGKAEVDGEICERDRKLVTELKGGVRA